MSTLHNSISPRERQFSLTAEELEPFKRALKYCEVMRERLAQRYGESKFTEINAQLGRYEFYIKLALVRCDKVRVSFPIRENTIKIEIFVKMADICAISPQCIIPIIADDVAGNMAEMIAVLEYVVRTYR